MEIIKDPFMWIGEVLRTFLSALGLSSGLITVIINFLAAGALATAALLFAGVFLTWFDRKLGARVQDRLGPNRVGKYGVLQPFADLVKLLVKEDFTPGGAIVLLFNLAPLLAVMGVIGIWAIVPFGPSLIGTDLNVGVVYIVSIGSVSTLAVIMAGWSSNNKYALLGAFRTVAQLVSYEIPIVLTLLIPTMLAGSMNTQVIVGAQSGVWFIVLAPIATLIFFIAALAEVGRAPFDLLEAESEIVAGYNVEYGGMKFGMFYVSEYLHSFTIAALTAMLFLGGWTGPGVQAIPILGLVYFFLKAGAVYLVISLLRFSMPRVRIDHLLDLNWKLLTPLALAAVIVAAIAEKLAVATGWNAVLVHLIGNALLFLVASWIMRVYAQRQRARVEGTARALQPG
jgi:NADH-quinone oxidoreductase subunit H